MEVYILAVMAFDPYMATCNPLLYGRKISRTVCAPLISVPYIHGFSVSLICTLWTYGLCFCGNCEVNHIYCADPSLLKIACGGVHIREYTMIVIAGINFTYSQSVVLICYTLIIGRAAHALCRWQEEGILHVWVPPDSCYHVFWDSLLHVSQEAP